jgi:hypothetical protein
MKPSIRLNWGNWFVGIEFWSGLVYIHLGPIALVW